MSALLFPLDDMPSIRYFGKHTIKYGDKETIARYLSVHRFKIIVETGKLKHIEKYIIEKYIYVIYCHSQLEKARTEDHVFKPF